VCVCGAGVHEMEVMLIVEEKIVELHELYVRQDYSHMEK